MSPAAASKLVITQSPTTGTAGQALGTALNSCGRRRVRQRRHVEHVDGLREPWPVAPAGSRAAARPPWPRSSGVATFSNLIFNTAGSYTLSVSDGSLTGATSGSITVSPARRQQARDHADAGERHGRPGFGHRSEGRGARMRSANVVTSNTSTVAVSVASGPGGFASGSTTSVAAVNGVATFSNLIFDTAGSLHAQRQRRFADRCDFRQLHGQPGRRQHFVLHADADDRDCRRRL